MKRSLSRIHVALVLGIFALASSLFPTTSLADAADHDLIHSSAYVSAYSCVHIVRFGDTLSQIALFYRTSMFGLMQANGIQNPNRIFAGTAMRVPCAFGGYPPGGYLPGGYPPSGYPPSGYPPSCSPIGYIVQPGDNLFRIGLRYGMRFTTLAAYNGLFNPNLIFAGMRLLIPCAQNYAPPGYTPPGYMPPGYMPPPYTPPGYMTPPPPSTTPTTGQATVVIQNFAFSPAAVTIHVGQTVMWRNNDMVMHTTTSGSCSGSVCTPSSGWDSGTLNTGQSFSHTFNATGTFTYYCRIHGASMQGTVVVMP